MAVVLLTEDAREDVRDLDGSARKMVLRALKKLEENPELRGQPLGARQGTELTTFRKLVVGDRDYRIVYRIEADGKVVVVWVVGRRADGEAYDLAMARLKMHGTEASAQVAEALEQLWQK